MVPNATLPNYFTLMRKELNEHISTHAAQPLRPDMCCMRIMAVISGSVLKKSHCRAIGCESRKLLWPMALLKPCNNSEQRAAGAQALVCVYVRIYVYISVPYVVSRDKGADNRLLPQTARMSKSPVSV